MNPNTMNCDTVEALRFFASACERPVEDELMRKAADEIEQMRAERQWVPVEERLPVVGGRYLVVTDSSGDPFVDAATWSRGVWWSGSSPAEEWGMEITHWMSLPSPPEVK